MHCSSRAYCRTVMATIGTLLMLTILVNAVIDPYGVYRLPGSEAFRPNGRHGDRIAKAEVARRLAHDVILLGDSRVLYGFDPDHPGLTEIGSVRNLAVASSSVYEAARMLDLTLKNRDSSPKLVVWGMPAEFVVRDRQPTKQFDFGFSHLNPELNPWEYHVHNLLSLDTTEHSLNAAAAWVGDLGNDRPRDTLLVETDKRAPTRLYTFCYALPKRGSNLVERDPLPAIPDCEPLLAERFARCRQQGVPLKVVIPPVHAIYLERLDNLGLWERIERGKRVLVQLAAEVNSGTTPGPDVEIWDFTDFRGPTTEPPPSSQTPQRMRWYLDASHFDRTLGNMVLDRLLGLAGAPADFGVRLDGENVESHLVRLKSNRSQYRDEKPDQVWLADEEPATYR